MHAVAPVQIRTRIRNPVRVMDSVDALDLLVRCLTMLHESAEPPFLSSLREQIYRHQRALRHVIGDESVL